MITQQHTTNFPIWARNLRTFPYETFSDYKLPAETKQFLSDVGLPVADKKFTEATSISFFENASEVRRTIQNGEVFLVIGEGQAADVGLSEKSGAIYLLYSEDEPKLYVNAGIEELLSFAKAYQDTWKVFATDDAELIVNTLKDFRRKMSKVDAKALRADTFWNAVLEDRELPYLTLLEDENVFDKQLA